MGMFRRMWHSRWIARSFFHTLYFNFHYLPFSQAVRLPILLYKPHLRKCAGTVAIKAGHIRTGMVILGKDTVSIYPNSGIMWENRGCVVFHGTCYIGNSSSLSIGNSGTVEFGDAFYSSAMLRLVAYYNIKFDEGVHVGWECTIMDTDLHRMVSKDGKKTNKGYGSVHIGKNNWLGMRCIVLKKAKTPDYCTIAAGSTVSGDYTSIGSYTVIGPDTNIIKRSDGFYRNMEDDQINYV